METRASYVLVGSFVLALAATASIFVIWLAKIELDREPTQYVIHFRGSVTGLQIGSAARYRGVPIGSVTDIGIDPENIERIRVLIEVAEGTPVTEDTVATLGLQGITGVAFIQLSGGTQESRPLKPKIPGSLAVIPSQTSGLEQVLEKAPELFTKAVLIADRLSLLIDDKNLSAVRETLANLQNLTGVLADRSKTLDTVLVDTEKTLLGVREAAQSVDQLARQLNRDTKPVISGAGLAFKNLEGTLLDTRKMIRTFEKLSREMEKLVAENRLPIRDFTSGGMYELSQFIAEARVLVAALTRLMAQVERDPARFFFGDTQKGFEAK